MTKETHVHLFSEDGDCIDLDCGIWRSQYIEQLEQQRDDLLAALEETRAVLGRLHAIGDNHGRPCAACAAGLLAEQLLTRIKHPEGG